MGEDWQLTELELAVELESSRSPSPLPLFPDIDPGPRDHMAAQDAQVAELGELLGITGGTPRSPLKIVSDHRMRPVLELLQVSPALPPATRHRSAPR